MFSPSSSRTSRSTPCVLGCCGPMLTVIVSVRTPGRGLSVHLISHRRLSPSCVRPRGRPRADAPGLLTRTSRSTNSQITCSSINCTSWTRAVAAAARSRGCPRAPPSRRRRGPSARRRQPGARGPPSSAAMHVRRPAARRDASATSPAPPERLDLPREHLLEPESLPTAVRMLESVVSAMAGSPRRSRLNRPTSSAAKCCASAALPPLPNTSTLPPALERPPIALGGLDRCRDPAIDRGGGGRRASRSAGLGTMRTASARAGHLAVRRRHRSTRRRVALTLPLDIGDEFLLGELHRRRRRCTARGPGPGSPCGADGPPSRPASGGGADPGGPRTRSRRDPTPRARASWQPETGGSPIGTEGDRPRPAPSRRTRAGGWAGPAAASRARPAARGDTPPRSAARAASSRPRSLPRAPRTTSAGSSRSTPCSASSKLLARDVDRRVVHRRHGFEGGVRHARAEEVEKAGCRPSGIEVRGAGPDIRSTGTRGPHARRATSSILRCNCTMP